ncbi:UBP-type zinc finger domain-containing protein [Kitasatospora sp. NPDC059088]|uniref:UBP-type zinc finger domain-containing protein n=1 Tax=Kitasatospora sp. NPDC059088 TaxID=3346722 RepID=UPI0036ACEE40
MNDRRAWRVAVDPGLVVQRTCDHLDGLREAPANPVPGCEECLRTGRTWVQLRACLTCGHVGCCDSSPGQHAHHHARTTGGHHIARSLQPGDDWAWCYTDEVFLHPARPAGPPPGAARCGRTGGDRIGGDRSTVGPPPEVGPGGMIEARGMGSIIVLFELESDGAIGPEGVEPAVFAVHAAGADPDVSEDPQPYTLCGVETGPMEHAHYRPARPGDPWYPPVLADRRCQECERALRTL